MPDNPSVAFLCGVKAGAGGLGVQSANAIAALALRGGSLQVFGSGFTSGWPLPERASSIRWNESPSFVSNFAAQYTSLRWRHGDLQFERDAALGAWAAALIERQRPELCYVFTQVGLETLRWARRAGIPTILENPNGHIRNFRAVYDHESLVWCGKKYQGHPNQAMIERVEEEYSLADRIRVSSEWSKASMVEGGVPADKIHVLQQPLNLSRFRPGSRETKHTGPLRVCFVGSLDLRKGFVYLLRAIRMVANKNAKLTIVGATGDRCCASLLKRERAGLDVTVAPGDPVPAYTDSELFVLPTLEDGSPFSAAEAMASGLPVVVTGSCGAAEWVREGNTGWIIPPRSVEALAEAIETALKKREQLGAMGRAARIDTESRAGSHCIKAVAHWVYDRRLSELQ
ncbi:MAG: glycosyltransferase family 4 protein [Blastocatellia bacterium]